MAIPIFQANLLQLAGSNWQQNNSTKCARRALCFIVWNAAGIEQGEGEGGGLKGAALGHWEHVCWHVCVCVTAKSASTGEALFLSLSL